MKSLQLKVDRIEEGIAVCYHPDGGMCDVPLPEEFLGTVCDGAVIEVTFDGDSVTGVSLFEATDPKHGERRERLDRLFGKK